MLLRKLYYHAKPLIPRRAQIAMRRRLIQHKMASFNNIWPIDPSAARPPANWSGWPEGKKFALILTHDVELAGGHQKCRQLMMLEQKHGFRSAFNFVPERYEISPELRRDLRANGFEVGVHGLNHDGKLYQSENEFTRRAEKINQYIRQWQAVGFRSPAMHHNLDWLRKLDISYDASTFDTDPFEPQSDAAGTIFPFTVKDSAAGSGYVELPYTLPQDFTLFILMQEKSPELWIKKLDWLAEKGGMVLVNVHPDYMNFENRKCGIEEFPAAIYEDFLRCVNQKYRGQFWHALPQEAAEFWHQQEETVNLRKTG